MHAGATIGFGFTSGWLKKWREISEPVTECGSNHKPKQFANYFRQSIENLSIANNCFSIPVRGIVTFHVIPINI